MRRHILFLASALIAFAACIQTIEPENDNPGKDEPGKEEPGGHTGEDPGGEGSGTLSLSLSKLVFSSYGGTHEVTVTSDKSDWNASTDAGWVTTATSGSTLTVKAEPNTGQTARSCSLTVKSGKNSVSIPVEQEAADPVPAGSEDVKITYTLSDGVTVAPKDLSRYITAAGSSMTDGTFFIVSKSVPAELLPQAPCKLIINTPCEALPNGLLADVYRIREDADGYVFQYTKLKLTDVFKDLDLDTGDLDLGAYVEKIVDAGGKELQFAQTRASAHSKIHIDLPQVSWSFIPGFSITPKVGMDLALKLQMIVGDWKLSTLNMKVDLDTTLGAELELKLSASQEIYQKLLSVIVAAIIVGPVVITPTVDIYAIVGIDGSIGLSAQASTVIHTSAALHYDELDGLSGGLTARDPEPGESTFSAGPKIEGGLSYGLGVGPAIGIYGDVISAGISVNLRCRDAVTFNPNLASGDSRFSWQGTSLWGTEFSSSILLDAALHLRALGLQKDFTTESVTFPLQSYKLLPPFDPAAAKVVQEGDNIAFKATVTGPSLLGGDPDDGELVLFFGGNQNESAIVPFDYSVNDWKSLWKKGAEKIEIKAVATWENIAGSTGDANFGWWTPEGIIPLYTKAYGVHLLKPEYERAARGILGDIRAAASSGWEKCNWDDDVPIFMMEPLTRYGWSMTEADGNSLKIYIPSDWELGSNLHIGKYTDAGDDFEWILRFGNEYKERNFDKIEILDPGFKDCWSATRPDNYATWYAISADTYIMHSPKAYSYPAVKKRMDVSGSGIFGITSDVNGDYVTATEIIADDCPDLFNISLDGVKGGKTPFTLSLKGSGSKDVNAEISINNASLQNFPEIMQCFPLVESFGCSNSDIGESVSLSGIPMKSFSLGNCSVASVSLSSLPKLESLGISDNKNLTSLSVSDCPALKDARINGNTMLKCSVPQAIDDMTDRGKTPIYDQLYSYDYSYQYYEGPSLVNYLGSEWRFACQRNVNGEKRYYYYRNNGYGFYYSGEPGKGYHGKN